MAMIPEHVAAGSGSRRNTESEAKIEFVQIDGLVVMKLAKHCVEVARATTGGIAQGALLGLVADQSASGDHSQLSIPFRWR